jgi:Zn-dependent protease
LNLILLFFNLLPFPPLDGSALPFLFLTPADAQHLMERLHQPAVAWIGIIIAWNLFDVLFGPIHLWSINLLYTGVASYG